MAASNACFSQVRNGAGNILMFPWMCPIVIALTQLYVLRSSLGYWPEAYPLLTGRQATKIKFPQST
jgi:hypothetical protein